MARFFRTPGGATLPLCLLAAAPVVAQTKSPAPSEAGQTRNPATPIVISYPSAAAGDGVSAGGFNLSRWAEDWSSYRDPKKRNDPLDRLKYLPIDADRGIYVTLSGELRLRVNEVTNPNLREGEAQRQDINRIVAGADVHITPYFRAYGEIAHGGLAGQNITPLPTLKNDLVVQQAFVEGDVTVFNVALGLRYGRQEFTDGSNLLTSQLDNNTIRNVLNGFRVWARGTRVRADMFDFYLTQLGAEGTGDDNIDKTRRFTGITAGYVVPANFLGRSKLYLDPFVWRLRNNAVARGATTAREERMYYGARLWGDVDRVTIDWTVDHQGGTSGDRDIDAWQVLLAQTYRLGAASTAPRIGFHADYASGGGGYGAGALRSAATPFGNNIYYSYQLFLTPTNLVTVAPSFTFSPIRGVRLTTEYRFAWRADVKDAVYRANGSAFAGTLNVSDRKIADSLRMQMIYSITPRLSFTGRYEHLMAGPSLTRAGYSNSDFLAGWVSFRF